jgi:chemotaxis protein MotB
MLKRRAADHRPARRVSHDRWLVSYADFITLLFAFFAMMYAVSSVDAKKFQTVSRALQLAFDDSRTGRPEGAAGVLPDGGKQLLAEPGDLAAEVEATVSRDLAAELDVNRLGLIVDRRGVIVSIPEAGTFSTGNDELSPAARDLVHQIAVSVAKFPNAVRVEGHADNLPIRNVRFRSNWDLSAARASRVVEVLIDGGVAPERLSAAGFAEFQPRLPNDSETARAANRRVDVVILNTSTAAPASPLLGPSAP